jgi:hypothetical protein
MTGTDLLQLRCAECGWEASRVTRDLAAALELLAQLHNRTDCPSKIR